MAWMSVEASRIVGSDFLQTITRDDLEPFFEKPLSCGWVVIDDAVLLKNWYKSYRGERARFSETLDYEVAVNGRAIPDLDLVEEGEARAARLLRRGVAFGSAALHEQSRQLRDMRLGAYLTAGRTLADSDRFLGNMAFCALRPGCPLYIDPASLTDEIVIALFTEDCEAPLPAGSRMAERHASKEAGWTALIGDLFHRLTRGVRG